MFARTSRVILLSGSPQTRSLDWSEGNLDDAVLPAFAENHEQITALELTDVSPVWRSLTLVPTHLPTGLSQASGQRTSFGRSLPNAVEPSWTASDAGSSTATDPVQWSPGGPSTDADAPPSQILSQYYEHSFAVHDELQSSQIVGAGSTNSVSPSTTAETDSFESILSGGYTQRHIADARLHLGAISDLSELPNAAYLRSIVPQTMTVNLVVGIISVSKPRPIKTCKGGQIVDLVELLVGDDTRAGFGINIWILSVQAQDSNTTRSSWSTTLRNEVLQLRPKDVILVRRVALSSFTSKVYGQSLRKGITSLDLLYRIEVDEDDTRGAFRAREVDANAEGSAQLAKVKKVKDWVVQFVEAGAEASRVQKRSKRDTEKDHLPSLPPDTQ